MKPSRQYVVSLEALIERSMKQRKEDKGQKVDELLSTIEVLLDTLNLSKRQLKALDQLTDVNYVKLLDLHKESVKVGG